MVGAKVPKIMTRSLRKSFLDVFIYSGMSFYGNEKCSWNEVEMLTEILTHLDERPA